MASPCRPWGLKPAEAFYDYHAKILPKILSTLCLVALMKAEARLKGLAAQAFAAVGAQVGAGGCDGR